MVQQAGGAVSFAGAMANGPVVQPNGSAPDSSSSLAVPAIVATNSNPPQQSQYSPQASLYQQQLIKSAHQFAQQQQQQQQQQQHSTRLNGLNGSTGLIQQQQYSANSQQPSPQQQPNQFNQNSSEGFYGPAANGLQQAARPAPLYAPKPTYYGQIAQQSPHANPSQMYQTARQGPQQTAGGYFQQQHSPALGQAQSAVSLTGGRPIQAAPQNSMSMLPTASTANPLGSAQSALEQQQRQMQHLVMSYQQQQEHQLQLQMQMQMQFQHQNSYLSQGQRAPHEQRLAPILSRQVEPGLGGGNFWPEAEAQPQLKSRPVFGAAQSQPRSLHRTRAATSDRDSVSTLSRLNQFDDRRSFTMRSQYTAQVAGKPTSRFNFVELTSEAVRQMLGLSGGCKPNQQLANEQLRQNMNLSVANSGAAGMSGPEQTQKYGPPNAKVTIIDSGEERQFRREVLGCRLAITRLLNLLLSAFVLLSPVAMLLVPKMEPLIRATQEQPSSLEYNAQEPSLAPSNVVTHAVGLAGQRQLAKAAAAAAAGIQQQPQWRISECQSDCDGPLIGFFVRLIMLAVAHWAIFFRPQTATLPRVDFQRCLLISLALLTTTAYWLFFVFRVFDKRHNDFELHYMTIVQFSISMLETLILLHYLALALIEWRQRKRVFCLKVVRSPDGESKYYSCGMLSIQKCAQFVLEKYHRDFGQFNSYKEQLLAYEDELAHYLKRQRQAQNQDSANEGGRRRGRASRSGSPRHDRSADEDETEDFGPEEEREGDGRASSRRSRRRHHRRRRRSEDENDDEAEDGRRGGRARDRTRSPARSPSRSRRSSKHGDTPRRDADGQLDGQKRRRRPRGESSSDAEGADQQAKKPTQQQQQPPETNKTTESADQSSDATSRLKESSLETIRASNEQEVGGAKASAPTSTRNDIEISDRPRHQQQPRTRDETESVRSARSRRSTGSRMNRSSRPEARQQSAAHSQRERSSSRARAHTSIEVEGDEQAGSSSAELLDDHERKLRRRRLRLLAAVEDSFEQVRLLDEGPLEQTADQTGRPTAVPRPAGGLDASQLARSLYPNIARPLQKYLRLTKQTGRHNLQSIHEHLSKCLLYKLSARAFLEKFTKFDPVWQQSETSLFAGCRLFGQAGPQTKPAERAPQLNSWSLICDTLLSREIDAGTFFLLKQGQVSLLVSVAKLPHLNLSEQVIDQTSCRFVFGPSPETTSV